MSESRRRRGARAFYLGLEIAVNDAMMAKQTQRSQNLRREASNEGCSEACEVVRLDELVQIDTEQLRNDAQVTTECERVGHANHVMQLIRVLITCFQW